ncbi:MAG: glycosyltransferase [Sulfuritalea sp.]|nr:glycosyltransferase [Sulfuritalea sp.]
MPKKPETSTFRPADGYGHLYGGADVFALTSREDPFPSVALEAMDASLPVVAFEGSGESPCSRPDVVIRFRLRTRMRLRMLSRPSCYAAGQGRNWADRKKMLSAMDIHSGTISLISSTIWRSD